MAEEGAEVEDAAAHVEGLLSLPASSGPARVWPAFLSPLPYLTARPGHEEVDSGGSGPPHPRPPPSSGRAQLPAAGLKREGSEWNGLSEPGMGGQ